MLLVGFLLLQGFNTQIPADSCRDLIALYSAPDDIHVLAGGEAEVVLCDNEGRGVSGERFFAVAIGFVCIDADIRQPLRGKECTDACRAEFNKSWIFGIKMLFPYDRFLVVSMRLHYSIHRI